MQGIKVIKTEDFNAKAPEMEVREADIQATEIREAEILNLYSLYSNMVFRIAISYLCQFQDAEDVVQAVFMKIIEGKAQPESGKERAFLTGITINHCKDVLRSAWKRKTVPLEEAENKPVFEFEEDNELFNEVMKLPYKLRIVLHLHYYEGYNFKEIASFLKISSSAVSMRIHRSRKILKEKLREDNGYVR